jgi:hypothetical protein
MLIAYLGTSIFYNQLYVHWIWSLMAISFVIVNQSTPESLTVWTGRRGQAPRRQRFIPAGVPPNPR